MQITKIKNNKGILTKKYEVGKSTQAPLLFDGSFEVLEIKRLSDLVPGIEELSTSEALCYSLPTIDSGTIVKKGNEDLESGIISKSKEYFNYPSSPGILMIDIDIDIPEEEVLQILGELYEPFSSSSYIYATSASNGINGKKGYHLYFLVDNLSIVKQAMGNLFNLALNKGHGYAKLSKGSTVLFRTFFDNAVYDQARMDFIAGPQCIGFSAPVRDIRYIKREKDSIDLAGLLVSIDASEVRDKLRAEIKPEQDKAIKDVAKKRGISLEEYRTHLETSTLPLSFILYLNDKTPVKAHTLTEDTEVLHPFDLEGGKTKFYYNEGVPCIHSFAHGGQNWNFEEPIEEVRRFPQHPEREGVLKLMRETYKKRGNILHEDTVGDMIDLMLYQIIDGKEGNYCLSVRPSGGKTQTILHIAWYLHLRTQLSQDVEDNLIKLNDRPRSLSITFNQIVDIEAAYEFLSSKGVDVQQAHSRARVKIEEMKNFQILLHTHFKVSDNDYRNKYFSYRGKERDCFIFDEAYYQTLSKSTNLEELVGILSRAILAEEGDPKGLPLSFLKDVRGRLEKANIYLKDKLVPYVDIQFPWLDERFILTAWRANKDYADELYTLFLIANAEDNFFRVSREKGIKGAVLMYKVNQSASFNRMISTDATRKVRYIHSLSPQVLKYYPVREPKIKKDKIYITPFIPDSKSRIMKGVEITLTSSEEEFEAYLPYAIHRGLIWSWATSLSIKRLGVVVSKNIPWVPFEWPPGAVQIPWGRHKQTDEFKSCDGIAFLHLHRIPDGAIKHGCMAEGHLLENPTSKVLSSARVGQIADDLIQAIMRGQRREGKSCPILLPISGPSYSTVENSHESHDSYRILDVLEEYFYRDIFEFYEDPLLLMGIKKLEKLKDKKREERLDRKAKRKVRSDIKYTTKLARGWAYRLRKYCKKNGYECNNEMETQYVQDKADGARIGPKKWVMSQMKTIENEELEF